MLLINWTQIMHIKLQFSLRWTLYKPSSCLSKCFLITIFFCSINANANKLICIMLNENQLSHVKILKNEKNYAFELYYLFVSLNLEFLWSYWKIIDWYGIHGRKNMFNLPWMNNENSSGIWYREFIIPSKYEYVCRHQHNIVYT